MTRWQKARSGMGSMGKDVSAFINTVSKKLIIAGVIGRARHMPEESPTRKIFARKGRKLGWLRGS